METRRSFRKIDIVAFAVILAVGIFFRLPSSLFSGTSAPLRQLSRIHLESKWNSLHLVGIDEHLYRSYVDELSQKGLTDYPNIVLHYIETQVNEAWALLPPVRFLYIFAGYIWHSGFGTDALESLRSVASLFSILTLLLAAAFAWRLRGPQWSLAVTALLAVAPTQIHMSQHALVDGFFTFWTLLTLWMLWESFRAPHNWAWLSGYTAALALLVLTKENSFFVWVAILVLLITNRWLQFGKVTPALTVATFLGPLVGVVILIFLAGGVDVLIGTYRLLVARAYKLPYAIKTGDGPWYRYLVDLFLVSPVIMMLAVGGVLRLKRAMKPELFMSIFIAGSYLLMCNVKYGMNLRYANMWDMPLRCLATSCIIGLTGALFSRRTQLAFGLIIAALCAIELHQYYLLFVKFEVAVSGVKAGLYELVTDGLLRALNILK